MSRRPTVPLSELLALYERGLSCSAIGEAVGLSRQAVGDRLRRNLGELRNAGHYNRRVDRREVAEALRTNEPRTEIAKRLGVSYLTVIRIGRECLGPGPWGPRAKPGKVTP